MKLYTKFLAMIAAVGLVASSNTSCTPEEAAVGGALIGAGAAIAIMNSGGHRGHRNYGRGGHYNHSNHNSHYGHGGHSYHH